MRSGVTGVATRAPAIVAALSASPPAAAAACTRTPSAAGASPATALTACLALYLCLLQAPAWSALARRLPAARARRRTGGSGTRRRAARPHGRERACQGCWARPRAPAITSRCGDGNAAGDADLTPPSARQQLGQRRRQRSARVLPGRDVSAGQARAGRAALQKRGQQAARGDRHAGARGQRAGQPQWHLGGKKIRACTREAPARGGRRGREAEQRLVALGLSTHCCVPALFFARLPIPTAAHGRTQTTPALAAPPARPLRRRAAASRPASIWLSAAHAQAAARAWARPGALLCRAPG